MPVTTAEARTRLLEACLAHYQRAFRTADPYGDRKLVRRAIAAVQAEIEKIDESLELGAFLLEARLAIDAAYLGFRLNDEDDPAHWRSGAVRTLSNELDTISRSALRVAGEEAQHPDQTALLEAEDVLAAMLERTLSPVRITELAQGPELWVASLATNDEIVESSFTGTDSDRGPWLDDVCRRTQDGFRRRTLTALLAVEPFRHAPNGFTYARHADIVDGIFIEFVHANGSEAQLLIGRDAAGQFDVTSAHMRRDYDWDGIGQRMAVTA
jgi:hypothetical protein